MSVEAYLPFVACGLYAVIQLAHAMLRRSHAVSYLRAAQTDGTWGQVLAWPSVDVLVPCYNEDPDLLDRCLGSVAAQQYPGRLRVFVVDDGSRNRADLLPVLRRHARRPGWRLELPDQHRGKRQAMNAAFGLGDGEIVITLDSDTIIVSGSIQAIVHPFQDARLGAVSGRLRPLPAPAPRIGEKPSTGEPPLSAAVRPMIDTARRLIATFLVNLADHEYWRLFECVRASQSLFRTVLCCNGGFSAYRRATLEKAWEEHVSQTFAGRPCQGGDDLHLTLLILERGYDSAFQPAAQALTAIPDTLSRYCRQQYRWSRSFARELWLAARVVWRRRGYPAADLVVQAAIPPVLTLALVYWVAGWWMQGSEWLTHQLPHILILVSSTLGAVALQARGARGFLYGTLQLAMVFPLRILALVSPWRDTWKTRDRREARNRRRAHRSLAAPGGATGQERMADGVTDLDGNQPPQTAPQPAVLVGVAHVRTAGSIPRNGDHEERGLGVEAGVLATHDASEDASVGVSRNGAVAPAAAVGVALPALDAGPSGVDA